MSLYCVYRPPFGQIEPRVSRLPDGLSLAEVVERLDLPRVVKEQGTVCINGHAVPRGAWHLVRPKAVTAGVQNAITVHAPIMGGGDSGGKNPLAILGGLALTVLSGGAAGGLFATGGGLFAAGSTSALFLAGGISLVGSLLLNALIPPPLLNREGEGVETRRDASARGNILDPNSIVPRVVGERRMFPPLLMEPLVTFDGDDEIVEAVYGLSGPHRLEQIEVGAAPIEDIQGLEVQTRDGWPGSRSLTLVRRYGRTESLGQELRGHQVSAETGAQLDASVDVTLAIPQPQVVATRRRPDVHELQLAFPQGLGRPNSPDDLLRVPFRLRIRRRGDAAWRNLPEVHYRGADFRALRATMRLIWQEPASEGATAANAKGFVALFSTIPGQAVAPSTAGWQADAYFYAGSGDTFVTQNNLGATGLQNYRADRHAVEFILDPAEFPRGTYEIEVTRGCAVRNATWDSSNYQTGGTLRDLFTYAGSTPSIPFARAELADTVAIQRSVSIWNDSPVATDRFALIAVRGRNVSIERLSVLAGGYVRDWDGAGWNTWAVTSNPAPHYRDVLVGAQNPDPLPLENLDDASLVEWRAACITDGHDCNAVLADVSAAEALTVIAGCGYARPYQSDVWGVIRDYDRSAEPVTQLFTPRNTASFQWAKGFPKLPDGLRVTFDDAEQGYEPRQISVFRKGISRDSGLMEQVRYEGVTTEAEAIARARFDLAQIEARGTIYSIDVAQEALVSRRGDLVGLVHDAVARNAGAGRVMTGGDDEITLDNPVPCVNEPPLWDDIPDIWAVPDIWALGQRTKARVRYPDGSVVEADVTNATGAFATLTLADPLAVPAPEGAFVSTHVMRSEFKRCLILDMTYRNDFEASLTLVDEAPEVFAA